LTNSTLTVTLSPTRSVAEEAASDIETVCVSQVAIGVPVAVRIAVVVGRRVTVVVGVSVGARVAVVDGRGLVVGVSCAAVPHPVTRTANPVTSATARRPL
jgi:hypothetical protein